MTEITVPDHDEIIVRSLDFDVPAQVNRSGWTGGRKVIGLPGAERWQGAIEIQDIATEADERKWRGFFAALRGVQNWFRVYLPCQSHIGPAPVVGSSPGNGYTLPLTGMQANTRILETGQHMTVLLPSGRYRAVRLTADLVTDGSGNATANFAPALSEVPDVGAAVETARPFVPVSATSTRLGFAMDQGVSGIAFEIEEA